MYTRPDCRRRGNAMGMLDRLVGDAKAWGVAAIALEATRMGGTLYLKYGFVQAEAKWSCLRNRTFRRWIINITIYLGANPGSDPALKAAVRELGHWIGECGHALVYGGSKSGLMGELAQSVLRSGGEVTGVEPRFFVDAGFVYDAITQLIVTEDMAQRKAKMIELGDAFIAFPGGTGTLEEIAEVMSKVSLGHLDAPCILYNLNGYYDGLKTQLAYMIRMGLSSQEKQAGITFVDDLAAIVNALKKSDDALI